MWFKAQPQLTLQGDPECGLHLRACPTLSKAAERSPAKGVLDSARCAASLVLGLGWGAGAAQEDRGKGLWSHVEMEHRVLAASSRSRASWVVGS